MNSWSNLGRFTLGTPHRAMITLAVVMGALLLITIAYQIGLLEAMIAPVQETVIYGAVQAVTFIVVVGGTIALLLAAGWMIWSILRKMF